MHEKKKFTSILLFIFYLFFAISKQFSWMQRSNCFPKAYKDKQLYKSHKNRKRFFSFMSVKIYNCFLKFYQKKELKIFRSCLNSKKNIPLHDFYTFKRCFAWEDFFKLLLYFCIFLKHMIQKHRKYKALHKKLETKNYCLQALAVFILVSKKIIYTRENF